MQQIKLKYLPLSPSKQRAVVKTANSLSMTENIIINRQTRSDSLSMETKQLVTEFYQQDDTSRIAPGKCDTVTVITANEKEKLQKRHLYMHIKETYAVFKDKHPNVKIGISKFASFTTIPSVTKLTSSQCLHMQLSLEHDFES